MTFEAQSCGLLVKPYTGKWVPVTPKESLTWFWMLLEIIPFGALSYMDEDSLTWWPHFGQPRKIQAGQRIHQSVFGTLPNRSEVDDASSYGQTEDKTTSQIHLNFFDEDDESLVEAMYKAFSPETHLALEEVVDESDASHKMPGSFIVAKIPEVRVPILSVFRMGSLFQAAEYFPKAVLHESLGIPNWPTFFSQYSQGKYLPSIEQDPFENATHILSTLSQACNALESGQGDRGSALNTLTVGIQTLQSFLDDPTRLSSLLEVPDAHNILLKAITGVIRDTTINLSRESKETLIRLFGRAWKPWREISTATVPRLSPSQVYHWGLGVQAAHRDDLLKVIQPFALIGKRPIERDVGNVTFLGADPSQIIFTMDLKESGEWFEVASIWDGSPRPAKEIIRCKGMGSIISRDSSHVAVRDGREVSIINTTTEPPLVIKATDEEEHVDSGPIQSLCFSDDCQTLASGHKNGWIKLWRQEEDQWKVFKRFQGGDDGIWFSAFSRDGSRLAFTFRNGPSKVWSLADDSLVELEDSQDTQSLAWSPGDWIVAGTVDGEVKIWSPDRGKIEHTFKAHDHRILCLAFRHDGQVLATGSLSGRIRIWRCHTWEKIWEFDISWSVLSLAFSPDGKRLASGSLGLYLWDVDMQDIEDIV